MAGRVAARFPTSRWMAMAPLWFGEHCAGGRRKTNGDLSLRGENAIFGWRPDRRRRAGCWPEKATGAMRFAVEGAKVGTPIALGPEGGRGTGHRRGRCLRPFIFTSVERLYVVGVDGRQERHLRPETRPAGGGMFPKVEA